VATVKAATPQVEVITSNLTREIHDALKRRCIYHWIDYPDFDREIAILERKAPEVSDELARELAAAMEQLRGMDLFKPPGVAETLDWGAALTVLGAHHLSPDTVDETLGVILKYQEDIERIRTAGVASLVPAS
jgi:MoxR-like ATPase